MNIRRMLTSLIRFAIGLSSLPLLIACTSASPTPPPLPLVPTRTPTVVATPTASASGTPAPSPTRDPYTVFLQALKAAVEQNDEAALRTLIAPTWFSGRYRAVATQYNNVADALAAFRVLQQGASLTLDLTREVAQLTTAQQLGERIVAANWKTRGGRDELAYLYASAASGEWRWSALITGVPPEVASAAPSATSTPAPSATPTTTSAPLVTAVGRLAFMRGGKVFVRDLADGRETQVTDIDGTSQWDWTRDGRRAVFVRGAGTASEIWTIHRDGSNARRLTSDNTSDGSPHWQPNGTQIVYAHNVLGDAPRGEIWLMSADGSNKRRLATGFDPAWSPDGQRIAFATSANAQSGIHLINAQGRNEWAPIRTGMSSPPFTPLQWQLSAARQFDLPQWSPDSREITLRASNGHGAYITTSSSSGGLAKFIALFFDDIPRGFSYSPDGSLITLGTGGLSGWETLGVYRRSAIGRDGVSGEPLLTLGKIPKQAGEVGQSVAGYAWSRDATQLAVALITYPNNDQSKPPSSTSIWLVDVASGERQPLIADGAGPLFWLP